MKRSDIVEIVKQSYSLGVLDSGSDRHCSLLGEDLQETAEIILSGLMLDGVFDPDQLEED